MNTLEQQFFKAVLEINSSEFVNLVKKYGYPESLLDNIPIDLFDYAFRRQGIDKWDKNLKFPLHYITACWDDILVSVHFENDGISNETFERWEANAKTRGFFVTRGINIEIPYFDLWMLFNTTHPDDGVEECVMETEENLIARGVNKEDINLYCAVSKFQFNEVHQLLEGGADPTATMGTDNDTCLQMITDKRDYYAMLVKPMAINKIYNDDIRIEICNLVGLAACQEMFNLLEGIVYARAYLKEATKEINYPSPYLHFAQDSRYLYVYITKTFGWGMCPDFDAVILYDCTTGNAKYAGWSERPISGDILIHCPDLRDKYPQPDFIEKGEVEVTGKTVINNMFDCNPHITSYIYDTSNYYIFMKSGERRRYLQIQRGQEKLFEPFIWLLDIVDTKY